MSILFLDGFAIEEHMYDEDDENKKILSCAVFKEENCQYEDRNRCSVIQKCASVYDSCFIAWQSLNGSEDIIKHQGCWTSSHTAKCSTGECKQDPSISSLNFCCCNKDFCNTNYTVVLATPTPSPEGEKLLKNDQH